MQSQFEFIFSCGSSSVEIRFLSISIASVNISGLMVKRANSKLSLRMLIVKVPLDSWSGFLNGIGDSGFGVKGSGFVIWDLGFCSSVFSSFMNCSLSSSFFVKSGMVFPSFSL